MNSAVYRGSVTHHRYAPRVHRFTYAVAMFHLFLDEGDELDRRFARLHVRDAGATARECRRFGHFTLARGDFLPDYSGSLEAAARAMYQELTGDVAPARVSILANLRSLGWNFNPITTYFFHDEQGRVRDAVAEVTNTPWGERHLYRLSAPGPSVFNKAHHVSPFLDMSGHYQLHYRAPEERFTLAMTLVDGAIGESGSRRLSATMSLERSELTAAELTSLARSYPDMAWRVSARIYLQALRLWSKGIPFVAHPKRRQPPTNQPPSTPLDQRGASTRV